MPRRRRPREVFISHSARNRSFVELLARTLRRHRIRYWYSVRHIAGAKQWHDEIGRALKRCDWFIVVLSPQAVRSKWVKRELLYALQRDDFQERIIPLVYRSCNKDELSWTLSSLENVDFRGNLAKGFRDLFRIWGTTFDGVTGRASAAARRGAARR
ncbi:MAG TPA: toll/interleukin-1 receptor domain-containing protein [Alphaproteobacteria bacterium]